MAKTKILHEISRSIKKTGLDETYRNDGKDFKLPHTRYTLKIANARLSVNSIRSNNPSWKPWLRMNTNFGNEVCCFATLLRKPLELISIKQ